MVLDSFSLKEKVVTIHNRFSNWFRCVSLSFFIFIANHPPFSWFCAWIFMFSALVLDWIHIQSLFSRVLIVFICIFCTAIVFTLLIKLHNMLAWQHVYKGFEIIVINFCKNLMSIIKPSSLLYFCFAAAVSVN